ncbi:MAG: 30S ribosomal protein S11 [Candidatus Azambacteria bacterium GW2011_GWA2_42_9]|uniref:Small ribosomal subunit protein uS11 n=3 Tax=Candidatus Azamiibacteriota TaxID=1752741 RepID=A0A0G0ZD04_9BACT|nr:MAG: 30S ribosomal protein S11 [Candidatus Azambacteria bacterium GW2011_GWB1_42_17]KKS46569.1 MAG: 30S ribosomal protein S11 [Candidatus Azambacteria bacterium GW2011_GWA1_42_19]KKS76067.1 MAG: 30S ribosomal protein S11 [Candidatus Azambacteria bacterium GW2011_GWA2_42_9]KKS88875.1 MAG: 30S ribosomal protein S11 [Parcubacteria group bacterium GW2011_GWC1_43_11]
MVPAERNHRKKRKTYMGKKKIKKQTEEELLKETVVSAQGGSPPDGRAGASGGKTGRLVNRGKVFVQASYNNTIITITDEKGGVLARSSAGSLGFKGPKKATPYASSKVAEAVFEKVKKTGFSEIEVFIKGIGSGRESAVRSLAGQGLNIISIKDITPIPHNGPRPKKVRRV